jgi:uncharacterized short protein YbdD (DUF466 family)
MSYQRWQSNNIRVLRGVWALLRQIMGEGAYERYCAHLYRRHPGVLPPRPAEFYVRRLEERYSRPSRCC